MNGIDQLLTQNVAALLMAGAFLWYLRAKDKQNQESYNKFNQTIANHLDHSVRVESNLARSLQKLCDTIKNLKKTDAKTH